MRALLDTGRELGLTALLPADLGGQAVPASSQRFPHGPLTVGTFNVGNIPSRLIVLFGPGHSRRVYSRWALMTPPGHTPPSSGGHTR